MKPSKQRIYAAASAVLALGALILGGVAYYLVTQRAITPFYVAGLGFFIPFLMFLLVLIHAVRGGFTAVPYPLAAGLLVIGSAVCSLALLLAISLYASTQTVTDVNRYERVLALADTRDGLMRASFPETIPADASDVSFVYWPALGQGGQFAALSYRAGEETIQAYAEAFGGAAVWVGRRNDGEAEEYGIFSGTFSGIGVTEEELSRDYLLYVMVSQPSRPDDWNHGKRNVVAIDQAHSRVIFTAENW